MSELDEKLSSLLSSPEAMEQVMNIVKTLSASSAVSNDASPASTPEPQPASNRETPASALLSRIDPRLISSAMSAFGEYSKDDDGVKLIKSLKSHLDGEHSSRIDRAVEALRLSRSVRSVLHSIKGGG